MNKFKKFHIFCEKFHQLLAVGRWFPPGTPVSSTRKLISSSSFHRLDMTLALAEALNPNKPNLYYGGNRWKSRDHVHFVNACSIHLIICSTAA